MIRHSFLLIYRNFKRFKSTFFINITGLSIGLACALLISLWVQDELSYDQFHEHDEKLFQVMEKQVHQNSIGVTNSTPGLLAEALKVQMPEVQYAVVASLPQWFGQFTLSTGDTPVKAYGQYASSDFFQAFSFPLTEGDRNTLLTDKNNIAISVDLAERLFGTSRNVLGKSIQFQHEKDYIVSGVFENIPSNSSLRFDFVLSFELLKDINPGVARWENSGPNTFVVLKEGADPEAFEKKIEGLLKTKTSDKHRTLMLAKYSDTYLYGEYENGVQSGGRIGYVIQFSLIAIFILLIACINFMNLSTAKASRRIKEVGIKKALGSGRLTLATQYMGESLLMTFLSLCVAILLVDVSLAQFNQITGKSLSLEFSPALGISLLIILVFTGLVAGSYPALYLSSFNPAVVLKGKLNTTFGELWARKGLVIFQFTLSVVFIVCVVVIYHQIQFLQTKSLGYNKDHVIYFEIEGKVAASPQTFIEEIKTLPGVINASVIAQSMVGGGNTTNITWEGKDPDSKIPFAIRPVGYDVVEMLELELVAGRPFSRDFASDSSAVIFNESAIDVMGLKDPVGKTISLGPAGDVQLTFHIIGVVKDFHYESLHTGVDPLFFALKPEYTSKVIAKLEGAKQAETLQLLQKFYQDFNPGFVFDYRFLDQDYQSQYFAEQRIASLSKYAAVLAIVISCLGLFGLAAFTAERRLKEIGIRKVLGSSEFGIIYLLSSDFTKIVLIAIVIALPFSYLLISAWLENFAFSVSLRWWYFIGAGIVALVIAWATVSTQAFRAARVNPSRCLRDE